MKKEITVPAVGESITEGTIAEWTKKNGEAVKRDEVIMVLETDKASVEVVAEADGVLTTKAKAGDVVKIGAVIGEIDTDGAAASPPAAQTSAAAPAPAASASAAPAADKSAAPAEAKPADAKPTAAGTGYGGQPAAAAPAGASVSRTDTQSPAVRRVVAENNLDPENIPGQGKGGRLTKDDAVRAASAPAPAPAPSAKPTAPPAGATAAAPPKVFTGSNETTREPMTTIRRRIAERLVQAQQTAAILTTFNEVDMTNVMAIRTKYKEAFEKKHGVGLGFMGFFVKAVIEGLKAFPRVNASIDGNDVIYHHYMNVGVAVGTPKGLMVPVLKHAESMSLADIELGIKAYAAKARDGKISIDDLNGGTFTISNGGVYGSLMSTPILNPPQSGILGMHKIQPRPVAIDGQVVVRPMMYLALSYDHRIVDGAESVSFLVRVKDCIEDPQRLLLEI